MLFLYITSILSDDDEKRLPELVGPELKRKKESLQTFLVIFGYHECGACKAVNAGLFDQVQLNENKLEVYFYDCHKEQNKMVCGTAYDIKSYPTFYLMNSNAIKKKPLKYESNNYSNEAIYQWGVDNMKKPFILSPTYTALADEVTKHAEYMLIISQEKEIPAYIYVFARKYSYMDIIALETTDISEVQKNEVFGSSVQDIDMNIIVCKHECIPFKGRAEDPELLDEFMNHV
ncbi:Thioredoxin_domain [Hexamita inflata]|uniref:Thioredoxin domain n=2 Tax=Hexamita inflata TaxID=28002 RepID=A0AA86Q5F1_9EUKA|nr:Thioredoxin domain [Hexamita inflata]